MLDPQSRCSCGHAVTFAWAPPSTSTTAIESAVDALFLAISTPERRWNMWTKNAVRSEFRKRLEAAERGELHPVDHVKRIGRASAVDMFEIRWQGITVHEIDNDGVVAYPSILARLLHVEPPEHPDHFAGIRAHEKQIGTNDAETASLQNAEIDAAVGTFWQYEPSDWGISPETTS